MTQRFEMQMRPESGAPFRPGAFDRMIGARVPMTIGGRPVEGGCKVVSAEVAADGRSVALTLEAPDGTLPTRPDAGRAFTISEDAPAAAPGLPFEERRRLFWLSDAGVTELHTRTPGDAQR
ncbi:MULTISPECIES: hypothetical protein [unclassified Streptomyces]|uniref:hypothetical protein n=1 Tax=unclassified Streptomyces TaxID=2593676 RepID=UPI00381AE397